MRVALSLGFLAFATLAAAVFTPTPAAAQVTLPGNPTFVSGNTATTASISWELATESGSATIFGYVLQMRVDSAAWPTDEEANGAPSGVTLTSVGSGSGNLALGDGSFFNGSTTGATVTGLVAGTTYEARIRTYELGGSHSAWTATLTHTAAAFPVAPTALVATPKSGTADTVTLTWTNSTTAGAAHYVRWRRPAGAGSAGPWESSDGEDDRDCNALVPTSCGSDQTASNGGLEITRLWIDTIYEFEVVAVADGEVTPSAAATATTNNTTATLNALTATNIPTVETGFAANPSQTFLARTVASSVATTRILVASDAIAAINQLGSGATEAAARSAAAATTGVALSVALDVTLTADATTYVATIVTLSGVTQTYILAITRRSNTDATLLGVTIAGVEGSTDVNPVLYPAFDSEITQYGISVDRHATASTLYTMTFTPTLLGGTTAAGSAATATAGGFAFPSMNNPNNYIFMMNGEALGAIEYILTVTAADTSTTKTYHFHIIVGPDISAVEITDATASSAMDDIPLYPAFNRNRFAYTAGTNGARTSVPNEVAQVTIKGTWTVDGPNPEIGIRGQTAAAVPVISTDTDASGTTGNTIVLGVGENIIDLVFEKTGASKVDTTYTFTIVRDEMVSIPAAPQPPTADAVRATGFTVNWTQVTDATNYNVRWRTAATTNPVAGEGAWQRASGASDDGEPLGDVAQYAITGLTPDTLYDFEVRASNRAGNSMWVQGAAAQRTNMPSTNAVPNDITVSGGSFAPSVVFDSDVDNYIVTLGTFSDKVSFTLDLPVDATAKGELITKDSDAELKSSDGHTGNEVVFTMDGEVGKVEYRLTITSENGEEKMEYNFTILVGVRITVLTLTDTTEDADDIPIAPEFATLTFNYTAGTDEDMTFVPNEIDAIDLSTTWIGAVITAAQVQVNEKAPASGADVASATPHRLALAPGPNTITLDFGGGEDHGNKESIRYTIKIIREELMDMEEMTQKAEAVAKAVAAKVVLSGVLDAVSQNAFDATGSFTPFVNVGARQALVPAARQVAARQVAAPVLLSEQPARRDADWRDLLGASAFRLQLTPAEAWTNTTDWFGGVGGALGESLGGGEWSVWGSGDVRGFNGGGDRSGGGVETEGMGYSGYLGTDYRKGDWLVGIAAGYSTTTADVTIDNNTTKSEFWLAGGYPYLRYSWQNRIDAWLLLGAGAGELMLKEEEAEDATALVLSHLYAAGAKANVLRYGNISLAAKADVAANFALSLNTDNLNDFDTMQQRVRVGVDVAYDYKIATHALRPHLEVGARLDFGGGGSIEIGDSDLIAGAEVAGGVRYEYLPLRISVDARGRALVYDTTGLLREWGAGATIRMTPKANGEGISASLTPGWGAPQSRIDNMWQHETPTLTQSQNITQALSLRGELAYTFKHKDARITPLTQYSLNAQSQTVGLGTRLNLAPLALELLGERIDHTTNPDNYRLRLQGALHF